MLWAEVIDNPFFKDLPFKIALNRYGKVEMTPASNKQSRLQSFISAVLARQLTKSEALTECSIQTAEGVLRHLSNNTITKHLIHTPLSFVLKLSRHRHSNTLIYSRISTKS